MQHNGPWNGTERGMDRFMPFLGKHRHRAMQTERTIFRKFLGCVPYLEKYRVASKNSASPIFWHPPSKKT